MLYLSIKTIHIIAVISWLGSLTLVAFVTSTVRMDTSQMRIATRITDLSIGVTWLAGIVLVVMGGWYLSTWWQIKIVLVILISAIHSILHRRWKASEKEGAKTPRFVPFLLLITTLVVVGLAVFKQPG